MQQTIFQNGCIPNKLATSMFTHRRQQFVARQAWNLFVSPDGLETDEYDDHNSSYLIIHEGDEHLASFRVRDFDRGSMLGKHFADAFPSWSGSIQQQRSKLIELTRFCRSPNISVYRSEPVLNQLAKLLNKHRDDHGLVGFVAVVYPKVARYLQLVGVRFIKMETGLINGERAHLICITHADGFTLPATREKNASADLAA